MAKVGSLTQKDAQRHSVHAEVEATYSVFQDAKGDTYLQIDTYGSAGRKIPGKTSQSIQFGPSGLSELKKILSELG